MGTIDLGEIRLNTRQAQRNLEALNSGLDETEKKAKEVGGGSSSFDKLSSAASTLKVGIAGGAAAFVALTTAITASAMVAERNAVALRGLGSSFASVRAATNDAMSAQVAFAAQNQITQSGLRISGDQLAIVARAAREFALRTGTDSAQAMQQLTAAIVSGDAQALRPFGVSVTQGTLRTQALRQALNQLSSQQQSSIAPARTLAEETERLSRSWDTFRDSMSQSAANALDLKTAISDMATVLDDFARGGNLAADALNHLSQEWLGVNAVARRGNTQGQAIAARQSVGNFLLAAQQSSHPLNVGFNVNQLSNDDAIAMDREIRATSTSAEMQAVVDRYRERTAQSVSARAAAVAAGRAASGRNAGAGGTSDREERLRTMSALDRAQLAEDQRNARRSLQVLVSDMQQMGYRFAPRWRSRMESLINGFLDPANKQRFEQEMSRMGATTTMENRLRGLDPSSRFMGSQDYVQGGAGAESFNETLEYLSGRSGISDRFGSGLTDAQYQAIRASEGERSIAASEYAAINAQSDRISRRIINDGGIRLGQGSDITIADRYGSGLSLDTYQQIAEGETGKAGARAEMASTVAGLARRNDVGTQLGTFFQDTQTLAEKGAEGFKNAFDTMSGAVGSFIDTLIEGQEPAGTAAVNFAKAALKGLSMQAINKALFETAEGFASLATGDGRAVLHFTAAGIYAGVAVATGAGAAGIGAAQRSAQGAPSSASLPAGTPGLPSSNNASSERGTVIFNINSTVFDPERAAETVYRLNRAAEQRGVG